MIKNYLLLLLVLNCLVANVIAQAPNWQWATSIGGTGATNEGIARIKVDVVGNVYGVGVFNGTVDFDPGAGIFNLTSSGRDIFIYKIDVAGNFIWAKQIGGTGINDNGMDIALDSLNNIYILGYFDGTTDFDPSSAVYNLTSSGSSFISKFDSAGGFQWVTAIGEMGAGSFALDLSGNIYITGGFNGTIDFDPGAGVFNLTASTITGGAMYISKFSGSGLFNWAKQFGGYNDYVNAIAVDYSGNVFTTGTFNGSSDFDPGIGTFYLSTFLNPPPSADWEPFILKLDSTGNFIWAKQMVGSPGSDNEGTAIVSDAFGNVYTTGFFTVTADFDPGSATFSLTPVTGNDIFISKLDSSGNFVWAKQMGGSNLYNGWGSGYSIAIGNNGSGDVYIAGTFVDTADFDPGAGTYFLSSNGWYDVFISRITASGNFVWAKSMGGTGIEYNPSIAVNTMGNCYIAGDFSSPVITAGTNVLINNDNTGFTTDGYIAKLNNISVGLVSVMDDNGISVYPNPTENSFTIDLNGNTKKSDVIITDIAGNIILKIAIIQSAEVNTKDFATGIYLIHIQSEASSTVKKLVVAK